MKSYLSVLIFSALITLCCAAAINYIVDPAHIFDNTSAYERGIAKILLDGSNVANIVNYDERITQEFYIAGLAKAPDIIAFGSSRSMQLRSTVFPGKTFFNHAVSGGTLEDHIALYQVYYEHGLLPKTVIIGADPWVFNANNDQTRWQSLSGHLDKIAERLGIQFPFQNNSAISLNANKYIQLFSFAYLEESIKHLWSVARRGDTSYFATDETHLTGNVELSDGSLIYGETVRNRTEKEVKIRAVANANRGSIYSLAGFSQLDSRAMRAMDKWIQSMTRQGIDVILFLPPYHPASYAIMQRNPLYNSVSEAAVYLQQLAHDRGTQLIGSYNGAIACSESEFTDDMHPKTSCINRIFKESRHK